METAIAGIKTPDSSIPTPTPYEIIHTLHTTRTGEPFTEIIDRSPHFVVGLSRLTDSLTSITTATDREISDTDRQQLERLFFGKRRIPAFYVPVEERTERLRGSLITQGYGIGMTDAWLTAGADILARPELLETNDPTLSVREVETDEDLRTFVNLLDVVRLGETDPDKDCDEFLDEELMTTLSAMRKLVQSSRGHCLIVDKVHNVGTRSFVLPAAVAAVAVRGTVAYISNVATHPLQRNAGCARTVIAAALRMSSEACRLASLLDVEPIVCLATDPNGKAYKTFINMGFEHRFTAQNFVLGL